MATKIRFPFQRLHDFADAQGNFEWLEAHWPTGSGGPGPPGPAGPAGPAGSPGPPGSSGGVSYSQAIGDGSSQAFTVTHNLGVQGVQVAVFRSIAPFDEVEADIEHTDANTTTVRTTSVPAAGAYTVVVSGPGSSGSGGGGDLSYVHTQTSAAAAWNVTHNLGKWPSVSVVDSGNSMLEVDVHYVDANSLTVNLAAATSGKAYMN
jgi:hypothetical protein